MTICCTMNSAELYCNNTDFICLRLDFYVGVRCIMLAVIID